MSAVALDTNLLLLLVIGTATGDAAGKRLKNFTSEDFQLLCDCFSDGDRLVVTPNVWTEVSNMWGFGIEADWRPRIAAQLADMIRGSIEIVRPSRDVIDDPDFARLGLTDCVWLNVLDQEMTLLTDDLALYQIALSRGLRAVNFTHLRSLD